MAIFRKVDKSLIHMIINYENAKLSWENPHNHHQNEARCSKGCCFSFATNKHNGILFAHCTKYRNFT